MTAPLGPAAVIRIAGRDAIAFAHGQFTSDVKSLDPGAWHWSAWLDAQGRARAVFALLRTGEDELHAWQPLGDAAPLAAALARFVLRAAARVEALEAHALAPGAGDAVAAGRLETRDGGWAFTLGDGRAVRLVPGAGPVADEATLAAWRLRDVEARLPLLPAAMAGQYTPQALDLEAIDAIRFDKGCYPGQEVAARLHFRGGNKRRLRRAGVDGAFEPGQPLLAGAGETVGHILYGAPAGRVLAVVTEGAPNELQTPAGTPVRLG